uniref:Uncharacterized protein n=1 Tax=Molossus molossus TaxID=27622 RepID=A0A7J8J077_MOLMO|nr:hypothetical protein HJG59_010414 [Molossus molossus]
MPYSHRTLCLYHPDPQGRGHIRWAGPQAGSRKPGAGNLAVGLDWGELRQLALLLSSWPRTAAVPGSRPRAQLTPVPPPPPQDCGFLATLSPHSRFQELCEHFGKVWTLQVIHGGLQEASDNGNSQFPGKGGPGAQPLFVDE